MHTTTNKDQSAKPSINRTLTSIENALRQTIADLGLSRSTRPLKEAVIDHALLGTTVVDEVSGIVLGRPWLTVALDTSTGAVVGWHLSLEHPTYKSVMRCLQDAVASRDGACSLPRGSNAWPADGVPQKLVLDVCRESYAPALLRFCALLGIEVEHKAKRSPFVKTPTERLFSKLARHLRMVS